MAFGDAGKPDKHKMSALFSSVNLKISSLDYNVMKKGLLRRMVLPLGHRFMMNVL